jgi:hypothetical protein
VTGKWVRASLAKDSITFGMAYHRILQFEDVLLTLGGETLYGLLISSTNNSFTFFQKLTSLLLFSVV